MRNAPSGGCSRTPAGKKIAMPYQSSRPFSDRREAGVELATKLRHYAGRGDVVVLALPRGGVPVAFEVAEALDAPLDVFIVRKLGMPGHPEYAIGAIASGGIRVLSDDIVRAYGISQSVIDAIARDEHKELARREQQYRRNAALIDLRDRTVILVDDGLATGSTMRAAVQAVRQHGPARVVVAVPVGAPSTCDEFANLTEETVCARTPEPFSAVGQWYLDFSQTTDEEVEALLREHAARLESRAHRS
jgi:predicted phosphoribosyltransferase